MADEKGGLPGEHFSVDGTRIGAWAGLESFVRKAEDDDDDGTSSGDGGNFKRPIRNNETHESKTNPDARPCRKGKTASVLRLLGHT